MNLEKVKLLSQGYEKLSEEHKAQIATQVFMALTRIEDEPKTMAWRIR